MSQYNEPRGPKPPFRLRKRWFFGGLLLVVFIAIFLMNRQAGPNDQKTAEKPGTAKHPVPVIEAQAYQSNVPIKLQVIGTIQSVSSVTLRSQNDGQILSVNFAEGQYVKAGQLLFVVDPAPFIAALNQAQATVEKDVALVKQAQQTVEMQKTMVWQAQANLKRDQALLVYAKAEENRYGSLFKQGFVTQEQSEQMTSTYKSEQGTVGADKAAIQTAEATMQADISAVKSAIETLHSDQANVRTNQIKLDYCYIKAPFAGRTGSLLVHNGDAIQTESTNLVSLSRIDPIFVVFSVPQDELPAIKEEQAKGQLGVVARLNDAAKTSVRGKISFIDNTIDSTTGTIALKGAFENPTEQLWPGQFVTVVLSMGEIENAVVIPPPAVQTGQKGDYVFVDNNGVAELRPVTVARSTENMAAISQGLKPGEQVITDGQLQLEPGSHVKVRQPGQEQNASPAESNQPHHHRHSQ